MSMLDDWPTEEEQITAVERGCTCEGEELDAYCVQHGSRTVMRATIDKLRTAIIGQVFKNIGGGS